MYNVMGAWDEECLAEVVEKFWNALVPGSMDSEKHILETQ
jgi:hypothetical protein